MKLFTFIKLIFYIMNLTLFIVRAYFYMCNDTKKFPHRRINGNE